jgi:hypothetical protein
MMEVQFSVKFRKQKTKLKMERRLRDSSSCYLTGDRIVEAVFRVALEEYQDGGSCIFVYLFLVFVCVCGTGISCLQSRCSTTWSTPPVHFALVILKMGSQELFARAVPKTQFS